MSHLKGVIWIIVSGWREVGEAWAVGVFICMNPKYWNFLLRTLFFSYTSLMWMQGCQTIEGKYYGMNIHPQHENSCGGMQWNRIPQAIRTLGTIPGHPSCQDNRQRSGSSRRWSTRSTLLESLAPDRSPGGPLYRVHTHRNVRKRMAP